VDEVAMPSHAGGSPNGDGRKSGFKRVAQFEIAVMRKVKRKELMHFSRQLAVFVRAGVPILDALETMSEEIGDKRLQVAVLDVAARLRAGDTFSGAASHHPNAFPDFYMSVLRSAELTGNLDIVLDQLADYIERDLDARAKVQAALIYPALTMVMAVVTVVVLTTFVLPRFEKFFASLDAKLPLTTRMLLNTSHWLGDWWWAVITGFVVIVGSFIASLRSERGKRVKDRMMLRIPVMGLLVRDAILERFCRILSALVRSGVQLPEALAVASAATNNAVYRDGLASARQEMLRGEGLARPLNSTGLFPAAARQMFRVGEDTGTLDDQLGAAAQYFDRELDYRIKKFTSMFEPAVIVFVGVVVGFVALALVSAMYGIFDQVSI
jgi:type IV pilus assembly protein PilC